MVLIVSTGQIEAHECNNISDEDDEEVFDNGELQALLKESKSQSIRDKTKWKRKTEDVLLSYNQEEEPLQLVEDFPQLPYLKPFDLFG